VSGEAPVRVKSLSAEAMLGLFFIQRYRFLSIAQFAKASGLSPSWAKELLLDLERREKLLGHFGNTPVRGHGKTPKVYFLKRRGYELLRRESDIPEDLLGRFRETHVTARWSPQMYHRLATIDLLLSLEVGVRERDHLNLVGVSVEYRRVRRNGTIIPETSDFVAPEETSANRIVPDAALVLENLETGKRGLFFLEVDMGTERIASMISRDKRLTLRHRMQQYDRYLVGGRFAQTYASWGAFKFFTLLFVTPSDERIENIRREMQRLSPELHNYYRFNTFGVTVENFFNEAWKTRSVNDDRGYPIIR
jgi:hypothetical protein